jgi:phosphoribosylaminoimidazole carboxylase PurE protein
MSKVAIIMGSDSDMRVMRAAADVLEELDVPYEIDIVSAHRTPRRMFEFATTAEERGIRVIVAGAGGAAHLPGMVASLTVLPVIGVPVSATKLDGMDSLLSIVQMPAGVPVATVAVDNARNAGLLAAQVLAVADHELRRRLHAQREETRRQVEEKASALT